MKKKIIAGVIATFIGVSALVGVALVSNNASAQESDTQLGKTIRELQQLLVVIQDLRNVLVPEETVDISLGATPGDEVSGNRWCVGGACTWSYGFRMNTAGVGTTTACSVRSPVATSTLVRAIGIFRTASTSAYALEWGTDPSSFNATTTAISNFENFAAGAQVTYQASSTVYELTQIGGAVDNSDNPNILAPLTYVNLNIAAGPAGSNDAFAPDGTCIYEFIELN